MSPKKPSDGDAEIDALVASLLGGGQVGRGDAVDRSLRDARDLLPQLRDIAEIMAANRRAQRLEVPAVQPTAWGPFRVGPRVGGGSFGDVYEARDPQLERTVALKLIHPQHIATRAASLNVVREARLLARVRHRNVVTVHGVEQHEGRIGIVMEFIEGVTIEDFLRHHGPLSPEEALVIGRDVCRALAALHGAGILHRDVKAHNVMREIGGRVVLMDLGIGCEPGDRRGSDRLGTPLYAAPELMHDFRASCRSDLYAVGVLLFHLVSGSYPVRGGTPEEILAAHRSRRRLQLRDLRPDLPEHFVQVVERALATDPDRRCASAGEMVAELVDALGEGTPHWPLVDLPRLEDEIARAVAARLADRFGGAGAAVAPASGGADLESLHFYLQGRYLFNQGAREDLEAACHRFEAAAARDPGYALAHTGIATASAFLFAFGHADCREHLDRAAAAAAQAVALAPELAEAHAVLGFVRLLEWDWEGAKRSLDAAGELDPHCLQAKHYRARYLQALGRLDEAGEFLQGGGSRRPAACLAHGWLALHRPRPCRIAEPSRMTETPDGQPPRPPLLQIIAAQSHVLEGRPERGIRELLSLVRETPDDPILLASLGWAHGLAGHRDAALELLDALRERRATEHLRPFLLARVYAGIGENDQAFAWLDRSVAEHDPFLIMIRSDQTVASLREDPRFGQILRRLNLP